MSFHSPYWRSIYILHKHEICFYKIRKHWSSDSLCTDKKGFVSKYFTFRKLPFINKKIQLFMSELMFWLILLNASEVLLMLMYLKKHCNILSISFSVEICFRKYILTIFCASHKFFFKLNCFTILDKTWGTEWSGANKLISILQ